MPLRKIARIVHAAYKDADQARRTAQSPEFRRAVTKDRRKALGEFRTVKHALRDRELIARAPAAKGTGRAGADRSDRGNGKTNAAKRNGSKKKK